MRQADYVLVKHTTKEHRAAHYVQVVLAERTCTPSTPTSGNGEHWWWHHA